MGSNCDTTSTNLWFNPLNVGDTRITEVARKYQDAPQHLWWIDQGGPMLTYRGLLLQVADGSAGLRVDCFCEKRTKL